MKRRSEGTKRFPWKLLVLGIALVVTLVAVGLTVDTNDAGYRTVIQYPNGSMRVKFSPGWYLKLFGGTEVYPDAMTYDFDRNDAGSGATLDQKGIEVQYGDGGMGTVFGTARFNMPNTYDEMIMLHKEARNSNGVAFKILKPTTDEAADKTAGLMNSEDGYASKRAIFAQWTKIQLAKGIFMTTSEEVDVKDEVTGEIVTKDVARIKEIEGKKQHQESPLSRYGITVATFQMNKPDFEPKTMAQIASKREATMAIITAKAKAEKAKQDAITAKEEGLADVMTAKYKEEVVKEMAIVKAEREKEVAEIRAAQKVAVATQRKLEAEQDKLAAVETRQEQIFLGEGESKRKSLNMEADGALSIKVDAWKEATIAGYKYLGQQKWSPEVVMGGGQNGSGGDRLSNFMDILTTKAAKDLSLNMNMMGAEVPVATN